MIRNVLYAALVAFAVMFGLSGPAQADPAMLEILPTRVQFPSLDGKTTLTGYLFMPAAPAGKRAAIVMMHGRAGAYSSKADGQYDASTLSKRHAFWGHFWADHGYVALLVDGFGPRGYPHGFPAHSYGDRPDALNEVTVRPLDAYGALRYLRTRPDIDGSDIALQGWSNGGSATIATMSDETLTTLGLSEKDGFKGGVAFYPACTLHGRFTSGFHPYAPLRIFSGEADEEVSADRCTQMVQASKAGSDLKIQVFDGATHDFDDPGRKRQSIPQNAAASEQAVPATLAFMQGVLGR